MARATDKEMFATEKIIYYLHFPRDGVCIYILYSHSTVSNKKFDMIILDRRGRKGHFPSEEANRQ